MPQPSRTIPIRLSGWPTVPPPILAPADKQTRTEPITPWLQMRPTIKSMFRSPAPLSLDKQYLVFVRRAVVWTRLAASRCTESSAPIHNCDSDRSSDKDHGAASPTGGAAPSFRLARRLEHDPEKWKPVSRKIMLHQNARAQIASI